MITVAHLRVTGACPLNSSSFQENTKGISLLNIFLFEELITSTLNSDRGLTSDDGFISVDV